MSKTTLTLESNHLITVLKKIYYSVLFAKSFNILEEKSPIDQPKRLTVTNSKFLSLSTVASMFQNLQNLANMQQNMPPMSQQLQQQMSQQMSQLAANLQGLSSMPSNPVINSPLNLSVSAPGK